MDGLLHVFSTEILVITGHWPLRVHHVRLERAEAREMKSVEARVDVRYGIKPCDPDVTVFSATCWWEVSGRWVD